MGLNYRFSGSNGETLDFSIPIAERWSEMRGPYADAASFTSNFDSPNVTAFIRPEWTIQQPEAYQTAIIQMTGDMCSNSVSLTDNILSRYSGRFPDLLEGNPWINGSVKIIFENNERGLIGNVYNNDVLVFTSNNLTDLYDEVIFTALSEEDFISDHNVTTHHLHTENIGSQLYPQYDGLYIDGGDYFNFDGESTITGYGDVVQFIYQAVKDAEQFDPEFPYDAEIDGGGHPVPPIGGGPGLPSLPTISLSGYGYNVYKITPANLNTLLHDLWDETWLEDFLDTNEYKLSNITSLHILPFTHGGQETHIKLGNKTSDAYGALTTEWVSISCGSVRLSKLYDNYLMHEPYCNIELYLPYVGMVDLVPSKVNGRNISITYHVHIPTGYGTAYVQVDGVVYASYSCNMATQCPLASNSNSTWMSAVGSLVSFASTPTIQSGISAASSVGKILNNQGNTSTKGTYSGISGLLNIQSPYLVRTYPTILTPNSAPRLEGKPTYKYGLLSSAGKGFVRCKSVKLDKIACSNTVKDMIETYLKGGVYI